VIGAIGEFMDSSRPARMNTGHDNACTGPVPVQRYIKPLYERIRNGEIRPDFVGHPPRAPRRRGRSIREFKHKRRLRKGVLKQWKGAVICRFTRPSTRTRTARREYTAGRCYVRRRKLFGVRGARARGVRSAPGRVQCRLQHADELPVGIVSDPIQGYSRSTRSAR